MTESQIYQVNPDLRVSRNSDRVVIEAAANTYSLSDDALWPFISEVMSTNEELTAPNSSDDLTESDIDRLQSAFEILAESEILVSSERTRWPDTIVSLANRSGGLVTFEDIAERLKTASVTIVDRSGSSVVEHLKSLLKLYPIAEHQVVAELPTDALADLMLVVASDEHDPILDAANSMALDSEIRVWAPVTPARGGRFRVGPWFYPNQSACYKCLRLRAGSTIREPVLADIERNGQSAPSRQDRFDSQPAMTSMMVSILADAMLTHLALDGAQGQAPVGGFVDVTYGLEGFEMSNHRVLRVPRCPECSPTSGTGYPQIWYHEE